MLASTQALPLTLIGEALFEGVDSFALIAIPLFVLTGDAMVRTGLGEKLLNFAEASFGSLRAGFGTSTVTGCGLFACISGSDAADAAAVGRLTMDRLVARGYPKPYACALVASGACTGILIPPSIAYIILGLVLGVSSSTLFVAAFVPGVLVLLAVMVTNAVINRLYNYEHSKGRFSMTHWLAALWDARFALSIPVIILWEASTRASSPPRNRPPSPSRSQWVRVWRKNAWRLPTSPPCWAPRPGSAAWCCPSLQWRCCSRKR